MSVGKVTQLLRPGSLSIHNTIFPQYWLDINTLIYLFICAMVQSCHVIHLVIPCIILHFAYVGYFPEIRQILFFGFFPFFILS